MSRNFIRNMARSAGVLVVAFLGLTSAQAQFHGAAIMKNPVGPDGTRRAHIGDLITATITVINLDDFQDTMTFTNIVDVVHHASGDITSPNLLSFGSVTLDPFTVFGGTNSINVTNIYPVLPGDGVNNADGLFLDDARAQGRDNFDGPGGSHHAINFLLTFPGEILVVRPCLEVHASCSAGTNGTIVYVGSVSNCGNTLLTNLVVSNFFNGAFGRVLGPTNLDTNQIISFTGSYQPTNSYQPATNTVWAWGTDELGLRIINSAITYCTPTPAGGAIGDLVWEDLNHNGLQDAGEPGIPNVIVRLLGCTGNLITTTNTDTNGIYLLSGQLPGSYIVQFVPPSGYIFTLSNVGANDAIDSDANPADGKSPCTTLASGEVNRTIDAGLFRASGVGDWVWEDTNHNGLQDPGEPGISNALVRLTDQAGNLITTTRTDAGGYYHFGSLLPGSYLIQVVPPCGYQLTLFNASSDDTVDSDANPTNGTTTVITLLSSETNNTVDIGLIHPPLLICASNKTVSLGSTWSFDSPLTAPSATNVTLAVLSIITNSTGGRSLTATCTWSASNSCSNSATCSQTVTVLDTTGIIPPNLVNVSFTGSVFSLSFSSQTGLTYVVERNDSLGGSNWIPFLTIPGAGERVDVKQTVTEPSNHFYRVRIPQ